MYTVKRSDVRELAEQIEVLAKEMQNTLDNSGDFLAVADALVRNSTTMIFVLGEIHASEQLASKSTKSKSVTKKVCAPRTYHRDVLGRFASK